MCKSNMQIIYIRLIVANNLTLNSIFQLLFCLKFVGTLFISTQKIITHHTHIHT